MEDSVSPDIFVPEAPSEQWKEIAAPLPAMGVLAGMSDRSLQTVSSYGRYQTFPAGKTVIVEGQPQDRFYVVVSGKLKITAQAAGQEVQLNVAEEGECLGEVSLLEPGNASATVTVAEEAVLWSMNLEDLRVYLSEHAGGGGSLLMGMAQCLSQRIRQANSLIAAHHTAPIEVLPKSNDRAITADNTPMQIGFFDRLKLSIAGEKKVKISSKIKL